MDRQAWIAVCLCIAGLDRVASLHAATSAAASGAGGGFADADVSAAPNAGAAAAVAGSFSRARSLTNPSATPTPAPFVEKTASLQNGDLQLRLTNRGGGIAEAVLPKHKAENGQPLRLNAADRVPIGAILEKPADPQLAEFTVVPAEAGSVQFERALPERRDPAQDLHPARAA